MKKTAVIAFIVSLLLYSCNQNKPTGAQIPVVGEAVDSVAIAQDTIQQTTLEESYEYAQTVVVSPKLVYDIRAYGGPPSHGEYCIIRRGADNKPDTVFQAERFGIIINAFTADLNQNGKEEVYIVMRKTNRGASCYLTSLEFDRTGKPSHITDYGDSSKQLTLNTPSPVDSLISRRDTIFKKGNLLIKSYVPVNTKTEIAYRLEGNKLVINFND